MAKVDVRRGRVLTTLVLSMTIAPLVPPYGPATDTSRAVSTPATPAYRLAYTYYGGSIEAVFVSEGDGSRRRRVTRDVGLDGYYHDDFDVDWAPDSSRLAIAGERNDVPGIFVVRADGTREKRITKAPCYADYEPEWSPDGHWIAFRHDYCERAQAFVVRPSGEGRRPLIARQSFSAYWSDDGDLVTFVGLDGRYRKQIFTAERDGSNVKQLTSTRGKQLYDPENYGPAFAPSGKRVVYTGNYSRNPADPSDPGSGDVCVVGSRNPAPPLEPTPTPSPTPVPVPTLSPSASPSPSPAPSPPANCLTDAPELDEAPSYSPDGDEIVFVSFRDGNAEIYKMDSDGANEQRLTSSPGTEKSPTWSPDGRWIAFVGEADGSFELFVMRSDASGLRRLTRTPGDELAPAWSPS